jgi:ELWxxDGT repeat protein
MRRIVPCLAILGIALALLPARLPAQTAVLLADVLPGADPREGSLEPQDLTAVGGRLFFVDRSQNLWVTDGTPLGTRDLLPLCYAQCSGPEQILGHDGRLLYAAAGDDRGAQRLWRTDGTRPGTFPLGLPDLVLSFIPGQRLPTVAAGPRFFFAGCTGDECAEEFGTGTFGLWVTDGSHAGTRSLVDGTIWELAAAGERVFAATSAGELWRSDGTPAGTALLADGLHFIESLTVAGGRAFFVARDRRGRELWTSDGTRAGTRPVTAFAAAEPFISLPWLKVLGGRVYFLADDGVNGQELWRSDGIPAGTRRLTATRGAQAFDQVFPYQLGEAGGRLIFPLRDPAGLPFRLWTVPAAATAAVPALLCTGAGCPEPLTSELVPADGRLVFLGIDAAHGVEPWSTDGTAQGTVRLGDLCPGNCQGAESLTREGNAAYFVAFRGRGIRPEIWASDGTPAGTRRIAGPVGGRPLQPSTPLEIAAVGQRLYFAAGQEGGDVELWAVDGPESEPRRVADLGRGGWSSFPHGFAPLGDRVLFHACDETGLRLFAGGGGTVTPLLTLREIDPSLCGSLRAPAVTPIGTTALLWSGSLPPAELWRTDGTAAGTSRLAELPASSRPQLAALPGLAVFVLRVAGTDRQELWASDGTVAGTHKIADLPGAATSLTVLGNEAFFGLTRIGSDFVSSEVWRTDGTAAGTRGVAGGGLQLSGEPFIRLGSGVHFFTTDEAGVAELWRLAGPPTGAVPVSSRTFFAPRGALVHHGLLYFLTFREEGVPGRLLWVSDGSEAGTQPVAEVPPSGVGGGGDLAVVGDVLVFQAEDDAHGIELWASDGVPGGTTGLLRDLVPGPIGSRPSGLVGAGTAGRLFFNAFDPAHGSELWQSDGTAAGTRRVQDLAPGIASGDPMELAAVGGRLYFSADDGETGFEPWYLPLQSPGGPLCQPSPERLCLGGGRFQVEVAWRDFGGRTGAGRAVPLTNDTGAFWFFDSANLELVVKVLDGNGLNGHSWVFYGALSNVEYTLTVTDTQTGAARRYVNSAGQLASVGDTQAFGPLGASAQTLLSVAPSFTPALAALPLVSERVDRLEPGAALLPCEPGPRRLCLNGGHFAVTATWKDFGDRTGEGTALPLTSDTGAFWFFGPDNLEVLIKVIDGRGLNGKFWVFYGALSNVEYELTVTDTETGSVKTYRNPRGRFASAADTAAFE